MHWSIHHSLPLNETQTLSTARKKRFLAQRLILNANETLWRRLSRENHTVTARILVNTFRLTLNGLENNAMPLLEFINVATRSFEVLNTQLFCELPSLFDQEHLL